MCPAGVYDTKKPLLTLTTERTNQRSRSNHAPLLPNTKEFSASRHIQESRNIHTMNIPNKPSYGKHFHPTKILLKVLCFQWKWAETLRGLLPWVWESMLTV